MNKTFGLAVVAILITGAGFFGIVWLQHLREDKTIDADQISLIIGYVICVVLLFVGWLPLFSHLRTKQ